MTTYQVIPPGRTIGILGGGQLGKMMAMSAKQMGYRVIVLDPASDCPCAQVCDEIIAAAYDDRAAAKKLVERSDVITYEFENVDLDVARYIEEAGYLPQTSKLLAITQNRLNEKESLTQAGLKVAPYKKVVSKESLTEAVQALGLPAVLKTVQGGYDGKGQLVIRTEAELEEAYDWLDEERVYVLEQWVRFTKELSVMVVRHPSGEIKTFPVAENTHRNNILHQSTIPASVSQEIAAKAEQAARTIAQDMSLVGALGVEMFLTEEDEVFVNELAPRPHNSGHYTIEACEFSQFEQHIRAICSLPLGHINLFKPAVMVNILGQHLHGVLQALPTWKHAHLHLYGKDEAKMNRKMGHITILTEDIDQTLNDLDQTKIWLD
ncbi:5-(carboxyamino)imidazole ribonucleotide synthase [Pullulanibacillus sp. KACC 23026]|uniref:5-(carboxyamino)imidazole ribonucleotide synthase n=1 Tax=Pullulanibacillus sp. KACC 23026 TaxID=3028315 RepID=UPI0023B14863|nr:5-(carboxyamino)imidazole ribonucleotide synthase [Pullulanibacillus sp. KACC 23026]WEG12400.1 5-(carboxyamino)imidazole ribonucleotide synthase [Pullulanibacillus sp. KACC 23026]